MPTRRGSTRSRKRRRSRRRVRRSTTNMRPQVAALQHESRARRAVARAKAAHRSIRCSTPSAATRTRSTALAAIASTSRQREYQAFGSTVTQALQFAIARPALGHGELAHRVQECARGPADQVHRMGRGDGRSAGRDRGGQDRGDDRRRRPRAPAPSRPARRLRWRRSRRPIVRSILSSAAEAFAGVFGFLAPIMGPFAAGPATAAQATVAGMAGAVASADIGMWRVPQDMLTLVHHNELVMPAAQAGAFRGMLSGEAPRAAARRAAPCISIPRRIFMSRRSIPARSRNG